MWEREKERQNLRDSELLMLFEIGGCTFGLVVMWGYFPSISS